MHDAIVNSVLGNDDYIVSGTRQNLYLYEMSSQGLCQLHHVIQLPIQRLRCAKFVR